MENGEIRQILRDEMARVPAILLRSKAALDTKT
jgi:hypothetical protein